MFGIGLFELLLIIGIGFFLLDKKSMREIFGVITTVHTRLEKLKKECIEYLHQPEKPKDVIGDDCKVYEAYDLPRSVSEEDKNVKTSNNI